MPRLYREAPARLHLGGLGQRRGTGHAARDGQGTGGDRGVLRRARARRPALDARYDDALALLRKQFSDLDDLQFRARRIVEQMAMLLQGVAAAAARRRRRSPTRSSRSRLGGDWGVAYGTLPAGRRHRGDPRPRPHRMTADLAAAAWPRATTRCSPAAPTPVDTATYPTLTYEVTGRIARITFNRPRAGQRDHAGHPARPRPRRRAGRSRPAGARDGGVGPGERLLRRLRPGDVRRAGPGADRRRTPARPSRATARCSTRSRRPATTTRPASGTRWSTTR